MASTLRPIRHEDRLSLVEHLDELRTRLIICVTAFVVCFGVCLWQDDFILDVINRPLEDTAFKGKGDSKDPFERTAAFQAQLRKSAIAVGAGASRRSPPTRSTRPSARAVRAARGGRTARWRESVPPQEARKPVTLGRRRAVRAPPCAWRPTRRCCWRCR